MPLSAGSWCELNTSSLGPGVALAVSQATLAEPLPAASAEVLLLRNGVLLCSLSRASPNARLPFNPARDPSFECVGPDGCSVHVVGYTFVNCGKRPPAAEEETVLHARSTHRSE